MNIHDVKALKMKETICAAVAGDGKLRYFPARVKMNPLGRHAAGSVGFCDSA